MPPVPQSINIAGLEQELRSSVEGEVQFDDGTRALYATDSSNYRQVPIGVVSPKSQQDVIAILAACRKFGAPVLSRGAGTSLSGQCCNVAVIVNWKKHLNRILEVNPEERYARVDPGAVCDDLRQAAGRHSLTWGPDPATHGHCTFGGMLGNNSCGVHSQMAGKAVDNVLELDIVLYDGTRMTVGSMTDAAFAAASASGGRIGDIYRRLHSLRERYSRMIREKYPQIPRRVSGYNLDELLPADDGTVNVARALVGSESTCVTILEAKVKLIPRQSQRVLAVLGYRDIFQAADQVPRIVELKPIGLEGFDVVTANNIRKKQLFQQEYLPLLPAGEGWLMVEFGDENQDLASQQCSRLAELARAWNAIDVRVYNDSRDQQKIWALRESALGANSFVPGDDPSWEGWEDSAVAPEKLGAYLREFDALIRKHNYRSALYGHFGQGCVHNRINFDFQTVQGVKRFRAFIDEAVDLVLKYGGSLSGEHGDGQARGEFLERMFGPDLMGAFREFKTIWDPDWKMNPGKLIDAKPIDSDLRLLLDHPVLEPKTHFAFPSDSGSFAHAVDRCVGVGKCTRKEGAGDHDVMCPSYMVTREEQHSTRGRARLLSEMLRGEVVKDSWRSESVKQALHLCLSCKGCKSDCPVNVDMATYKAEFLSHYWEGKIRPLHAYAFGRIDLWARMASHAPAIANGVASGLKTLAGVHPRRRVPEFARQTFRQWFGRRQAASSGKPVLLFPDTFNNYFRPDTAAAAVEVLDHAGYRVDIPEKQVCCGRPLYDHGFLESAKEYLLKVLNTLQPHIDAGTPVVVLEPSCCSVFRDEMPNLLPNHVAATRLSENTFTLAEFLQRDAGYTPPLLEGNVVLQSHCHEKSVLPGRHELGLLRAMGLAVSTPEAGCCGMAGAFGYEKDKYDVSVACAERVLLPTVKSADSATLLVADGFSCREQIEQLTGRKTQHLSELLRRAQTERLERASSRGL